MSNVDEIFKKGLAHKGSTLTASNLGRLEKLLNRRNRIRYVVYTFSVVVLVLGILFLTNNLTPKETQNNTPDEQLAIDKGGIRGDEISKQSSTQTDSEIISLSRDSSLQEKNPVPLLILEPSTRPRNKIIPATKEEAPREQTNNESLPVDPIEPIQIADNEVEDVKDVADAPAIIDERTADVDDSDTVAVKADGGKTYAQQMDSFNAEQGDRTGDLGRVKPLPKIHLAANIYADYGKQFTFSKLPSDFYTSLSSESYGIDLFLQKSKWAMSSGLAYTTLSQNVDADFIENVDSNSQPFQHIVEGVNSFEYIMVPIGLRYQHSFNRLSVFGHGGIRFGFLQNTHGLYIDPKQGTLFMFDDPEVVSIRIYDEFLQLGAAYKLSNRLDVFSSLSLANVSKSIISPTDFRPVFRGVRFGVEVRLR
jgi:hypothetical protein